MIFELKYHCLGVLSPLSPAGSMTLAKIQKSGSEMTTIIARML